MRAPAHHRRHANYVAFLVHRVSGLLLAAFVPLHFYVLGLAIEEAAALDGFLAWTDNPTMKLVETGLVLLLAAHLAGGLRLLAIEFLPWRDGQKTIVALTAGCSLAVALVFLLNAT